MVAGGKASGCKLNPYLKPILCFIKHAVNPCHFKGAIFHLFMQRKPSKLELEFEVLKRDEAEMKPAGKGREEPNMNPYLHKPKYESSYTINIIITQFMVLDVQMIPSFGFSLH